MRGLVVAAAVATAVAAPALAEDWDFMLTNNAGKTIKTIELSPAGGGNWQPNRVDAELRKETAVKAGGKTTIRFDKGSGCKYDIKATFDDDSSAVWSGFDVCANSYVTLSYAGGKATFKAQ
jgi:hypothetical protein